MADQQEEKRYKRRSFITKAGGGTLAVVAGSRALGEWKKPVIDSVILPAHAVTSENSAQIGENERNCRLVNNGLPGNANADILVCDD